MSAFALSGCLTLVDTEGSQEQRSDAIVTLGVGERAEGQELRQTITSRRAGFNRIELWLRPVGDDLQTQPYVTAELRRNPGDPEPLAKAIYTPAQLKAGDTVAFDFPPLSDSEGARYELRLRSLGGPAQVLGRFEDVYGDGTSALDGAYLLADSAFRISYDYDWRALGEDFGRILQNAWLLLPLIATLLLPGWLVLEYSRLGLKLDGGEKVALSLGISLAVVPLVMAWSSWLGLHWRRPAVLSVVGFLAALGVYRLWQKRRDWRIWGSTPSIESILNRLKAGPSVFIALLGIFVISLVVRMAMVRDLSAPPWVDSVHHALITRLIMDSGTFPQSYAPYIQIDGASYHPGFHAVQALYLWLSGQDLVSGMLIFGQVLNALTVFSVYVFTRRLTGSRPAGLLAALVAGLFTPMPAYYTSWGRYTQLAALIILPAALALLLDSAQPDETKTSISAFIKSRWKGWLITALCLAGLFLTHYRVAAFFGCLLLSYGLVQGTIFILRRGANRRQLSTRFGYILIALLTIGFTGLLLAAPWMLASLQNLLLPRLSAWLPATPQPFDGVTWAYLNTAWGGYALVLAGLGFAWGLIRRQAFPIILALWVGLLFLIANLGMFGLPGSGFVNGISVTISLYLPIAALAGYILSQLALAWKRVIPLNWQGVYRWGLAALGVGVAILAARPLIPLLNPVTFLYRPADQEGIAWIAQNIPADETVLVNPFAWGYGQYAGNDGGYWISASGERVTFPPPVLYGLSNSAEYIQNINTTSQKVIDLAGEPAGLHALLQEQKIRYVYIGGRGGVLSAQTLRSSPLFAPRYARDGVFVFEVLP